MFRKAIAFLSFVLAVHQLSAAEYDICVYGGTSAGILAAYTGAKMGKKVVIIEPSGHWGGLTTGGLGYTDIGNKQVVIGLAKQFYRKLGVHYGSLEQWVFEPSVAKRILLGYLNQPNVTSLSHTCLSSVTKKSGRISQILVETALKTKIQIKAKYFIDCSYEGDLMAGAKVSYVIGRESNETYHETYNGVQMMQNHQFPDGIDPYIIKGDSSSGLLWGISPRKLAAAGSGDALVQAYNFRICLTSDPGNMIPITRPARYDSCRYDLLLRLMEAQPTKNTLNSYFIWSKMPHNKTDVNNRGGFSTDMIGANHHYPEATEAQRAAIVREHTDYTQGLLYFMGHDMRVSERIRNEMLKWGYPKDEFEETHHWTPQLYVREARRMVGEYIATQADCEGRTIASDGVAMAAYTMDSHNCQRIVIRKDGKNMVKNEGNVEIKGGGPYPISYRSLVPKRSQVTNLLVPVCLSASHIAYGSIRMEPVFMVLGQVSAIAACKAIEQKGKDVQDVDFREINTVMRENPYMDHTIPDVIVDNADPGVQFSSAWKLKKSNDGYAGSFLEINSKDTAECVYFPVSIREKSNYAFYIYRQSDPKQSPRTRVEMQIGGRTFSKELSLEDMNVEGQTKGAWIYLGKFAVDKQEKTTVKIINQPATGVVRADAILLVAVP